MGWSQRLKKTWRAFVRECQAWKLMVLPEEEVPRPIEHRNTDDEVTEPLYFCNCIVFKVSVKPKTCQHVESAFKDPPS